MEFIVSTTRKLPYIITIDLLPVNVRLQTKSIKQHWLTRPASTEYMLIDADVFQR